MHLSLASRLDRTYKPGRWEAVDVVRGLAIVAMVVYHSGWDLSYFKLVGLDAIHDPAWRWFARSIAGTFLALSGVGLAMAHAQGMRWRAFLIRLAKIAGAAALVTIATLIAFPDSFIFFGILHCIAVSSILALPFLRSPLPVPIITAAVCFALPHLVTSPAWDRLSLDWLGLGQFDPRTIDYVPIFPWFGMVLLGVAIGRLLVTLLAGSRLQAWHASHALGRGLIMAGRWSLPIYLLHQPLLFGLFYLVFLVTGPSPAAQMQGFLAQCQVDCGAINHNERLCRAMCGCIAEETRRTGLWPEIVGDRLTPDATLRISRIAQQCLRNAPP